MSEVESGFGPQTTIGSPSIDAEGLHPSSRKSEPQAEGNHTVNGHEIGIPTDKMSSSEFKLMASEYGIVGKTPEERAESLKGMSVDSLALFLTEVNRRIQGSGEPLISDEAMNIGGQKTIAPEDRDGLFMTMVDEIKRSEGVNPARLGDAVGLGVVMLHPFKDGNGRTARLMALLFRDEYDNPGSYEETYEKLIASKELMLKAGEKVIIPGFVPMLGEGKRRDNPEDIEEFFRELMRSDKPLYMGPAGQAKVKQ